MPTIISAKKFGTTVPAFEPTPIGVDPVLAYDAADVTTVNGNEVQSWTGSGTVDSTLTAPDPPMRPIVSTSGSYPVVTFDGTSSYLTDTAVNWTLTGLTGATVAIVYSPTQRLNTLDYVYNMQHVFYLVSDFRDGFENSQLTSTAATLTGRTTFDLVRIGQLNVLTFRVDNSGTPTFNVNGQFIANNSIVGEYRPDHNVTEINLGGEKLTGPNLDIVEFPFQGGVAELRIYDERLSDADTATVHQNMMTKYGIPA